MPEKITKKAKKKQPDYFRRLELQGELLQDCAALLEEALSHYDFLRLPKQLEQMHRLAEQSGGLRRAMVSALIEDFLPPMERGDFMALSAGWDCALRRAERTLRHFLTMRTAQTPQAAVRLAHCFCGQATALRQCAALLPQRKKQGEALLRHTRTVDALEEQSDQIYMEALQELFAQQPDPRALLVWRTLFAQMKERCDEAGALALTLESAVMKNL
ncbi:MAG: hypothetical protein LBQ33_01505 [Oscillospiraceae bacterium]|jgi:uncharacterized protein Yka (UPF0111/DUF47 family)|nr:hypothetical protein [Oscillospiraceae bacterium]